MRVFGFLSVMICASLSLPAKAEDTKREPKAPKPIIAVYDLEGMISESGTPEASLFSPAFDASRPLTLLDVTRSLAQAAGDDAVKAIVLDVDGASLNFAQIQELRRRMLAVRESGKDVWLYTEYLGNGTALLGSAATHFTLMPEASCSFHGIHTESMYFKGLLDKLGVKADVIHIGDFKSFGEIFYRTGPSEQAKQQEQALLDSVFTQLVTDIASGRKAEPEKIRAIIDNGALTAKDAVEAGLADQTLHRTDFVAMLHETYGEDAKFDRGYELPDLDGPEINGFMDLMKLMFSQSDKGRDRADYVAVVALDGDITDASVAPVRTQILRLAKEPRAKALVLRVNSPGGSALASEVLWEATDEWKKTGKPFVVSMGGVAASGGYYVSSSADRIFAEAGTITGSIGVVGMKFVFGDAMAKIGVTTHSMQRGKNAGAMSMTRGFSEDEAALVRKSMAAVYETFKKRITDGRGKALKHDLESLAGGRVYSGADALSVGLVDEIGGLEEAVAHAAKSAELETPEVKLLPEPKSGIEGLFAKPEKKEDDEIIRVGTLPSPTTRIADAILASGLTHSLPAPARQSVSRLASRMEAFRECRVLLLGPDLDLR